MAYLKFLAKMEIRGINPYVLVSRVKAEQLQKHWRRPMPVLVRVNGQPRDPWHINMMPVGDGRFYLYLHESVRKVSGTGVGDTVEVEVAFDESYRPGPVSYMPDWFRAALDKNAAAKVGWERLSPSRQKEVARYLGNLKSPEAQARNLEKVLSALAGDSIRLMGRSWSDGS